MSNQKESALILTFVKYLKVFISRFDSKYT